MSKDRDAVGHEVTSTRTLLRAVVILGIAIIVSMALTTIAVVKLVNQAASQKQLQHIQTDSCQVFRFVADRFLVPNKAETPAQMKITAQFAGKLQKVVADCVKGG
jgi:hypothetical protein